MFSAQFLSLSGFLLMWVYHELILGLVISPQIGDCTNRPIADGSSQDHDCVDEFHFLRELLINQHKSIRGQSAV